MCQKSAKMKIDMKVSRVKNLRESNRVRFRELLADVRKSLTVEAL